MELLQKLQSIQLELKVHKGQRNSFGKYNYRSAEDILEAIKPLSEKHNVMFKTSDELREIGGRVYVETTVKIIDVDNMELQIESKGQAIIDFDAKGMQMPQRTGAASAYAKKYAYGNLLLIDDTKDADATNSHGKDFKKSKPELKGDALDKAIKYVKDGGDVKSIQAKYTISADNLKKLK
jgi:hypothetical protein